MVLDLGSFTRRRLLVDHVYPVGTWGGRGTKHVEGRWCKTRNEAEKDGETTDLSAMAK